MKKLFNNMIYSRLCVWLFLIVYRKHKSVSSKVQRAASRTQLVDLASSMKPNSLQAFPMAVKPVAPNQPGKPVIVHFDYIHYARLSK